VKIVVGLGNPGKRYASTPHNAGFAVADELAERYGCGFRSSTRFRSRIARTSVPVPDLLLVKPQTYMNESGPAVATVLRYWKAGPGDLIVVLDDADLDAGRIRVRGSGSSGGHKGLDSIIGHVGSSRFARVRVGIGRGEGRRDLVAHVLRPMPAAEWESMLPVIRRAADAVHCTLCSGVEAAMNEYNAWRPDTTGSLEEKDGARP